MAHNSRLGIIVIDCKVDDLAEAAQFWSEALGCAARPVAEHPEYIELVTPEGHVRLALQAVSHEPRLHMDIETDDRIGEQRRLQNLGATVVKNVDAYGRHWTVMEAPTGHRFCLVKPKGRDFERAANSWSDPADTASLD